ncbi:hypothetical protein ACFL31_03530 [Candidatus Margulisiibacteriota bacterium]
MNSIENLGINNIAQVDQTNCRPRNFTEGNFMDVLKEEFDNCRESLVRDPKFDFDIYRTHPLQTFASLNVETINPSE